MIIYYAEFLGTFIFMFIGLSITTVAYSYYDEDELKALMLTSVGWALAYFLPSVAFGEASGPHLNPAITIALVVGGMFESLFMWGYMIMQAVGALFGTIFYYIIFHDKLVDIDLEKKTKCFCIIPNHKNIVVNIICEFMATFMLVFGILSIAQVFGIRTEIIYIYVLLIMITIGLIFDYTSVALNPFRDLLPRILYLILPMGQKQKLKPGFIFYIIVTMLIPVIAAICGTLLYNYLPWDTKITH